MQFAHFTSPTGKMVAIAPSQIVDLRETVGADPHAKTEIVLANGVQSVRETLAEVETILAKV